jgi:hypothetical protein
MKFSIKTDHKYTYKFRLNIVYMPTVTNTEMVQINGDIEYAKRNCRPVTLQVQFLLAPANILKRLKDTT